MKIKSLLTGIMVMAGLLAGHAYTLEHPCLLHTQEDFDYVKAHLQETPYREALAKLKGGRYCVTSYQPSPVEYLARLDANNWKDLNWRWEGAGIADLWYEGIHNNYTNFMRDAAAAYQLALLYKLEDNTKAADAARNIIVRWSEVNKGLLRNTNGEIVDPNEKLIMFQPYQMAVAAEMLRDYKGWETTEEFRKVTDWLDRAFYSEAHAHLELQNQSGGGHYWMNWDLAQMATILALGVLRDNDDYIDEAIGYYKRGGGPGNIRKGVPYLHQDPDSDETIGQGNELGRDQGHNSLCAAVLATFCQMGMAIGEDLFAYDDYRALKFAEYVAKYNLAHPNLYPDPMKDFPNMGTGSSDEDFIYPHASFPFRTYTYSGGTMTEPSQASRGQVRPGWDYFTGYANAHGLSAIYILQIAANIRPDGGGGHYSLNSGGFDQIGFSTLMGYRPYAKPAASDSVSYECVADVWVRQDSQKINNGGEPKVELRKIDILDDDKNIIGANYHVGLITFKYELPEDKIVDKAYIHLVTERVKGNEVSVYPYGKQFNENTATWETEGAEIAAAEQRGAVATFTAAGQKGKAIYDGGITADRRNLGAWTNSVDVSDYISSLPEETKRVSFMLKQSGDQVCFFSKDNAGQQKAFKDTEDTTDFEPIELMPYLEVHYKSSDLESEDDDVLSAIENIGKDLCAPVYFNLQGQRVKYPQTGEFYIVRTANSVEKIVYAE